MYQRSVGTRPKSSSMTGRRSYTISLSSSMVWAISVLQLTTWACASGASWSWSAWSQRSRRTSVAVSVWLVSSCSSRPMRRRSSSMLLSCRSA